MSARAREHPRLAEPAPPGPRGRFTSRPARRRCGPVPRGAGRGSPAPHPRGEARPSRRAASAAPPAGVTLGHSAAASRPSFSIPAWPWAAPRDEQKGRTTAGAGAQGDGHLSSRCPQAVLLSLLFLKITKLVHPVAPGTPALESARRPEAGPASQTKPVGPQGSGTATDPTWDASQSSS